ncbi:MULTISPECIES: site-specific integrase [unclassified Mesorhizobium]|uniref:tyrosine-type recombinase/integrase n=1 Tax=unclassified Mesorhizobium TaxID=325217 RepID=UPI0010933E1B|nr:MULTISPECIES: site-specific integrase [unclassified Mesorhizobium]TGS46394.1 site-specific integrase [Mesorhizobium sp. M8A.F.Ca.ET.182.01.1.1]TGS81851.1 site-specific integrase [Mesorhizobium sp. M8A.F.Ca.ET.181.01.1.1]
MLGPIPGQFKKAAAFITALKPTTARQEIPDSAQAGLYLVMQPSGALSWAVRTKIDGKASKVTVGRYDEIGSADDRIGTLISPTQALNVTQARAAAEKVIADAKRGNDPRQQKIDKTSVSAWFDEFIKTARATGFKGRAVKASTADEYERIIATNIKPHWKHVTDIRTIDYRDVEKLLAKLTPGARRNAFAVLSAFFRWKPVARAMGRNIIELAEAPAKPNSRDRVLATDEIKTVWKASEKCGYPFGPMAQLLLLTGQRRDEIAELKWRELSDDLDTITLEASRTKNSRPHVVPLSPLAQTIIKALPRIADADGNPSEYVFTTTATTPFSGFSNGKKALDKHCGEPALPDWHLHDLRRTCATELAKLGIKQEVTEAILNHKTGKVSGVAAIYNRYDYQDEKRDALENWATRIAAITANNVTLLSKRA